MHDRIEVMPSELTKAQNFRIICYIGWQRSQEEVSEAQEVLNSAIDAKKEFNSAHASKLTPDQKEKKVWLKGEETRLRKIKCQIESKSSNLKKIRFGKQR